VNPHPNFGGEFQVSHSPSLDSMEGSGTTAIGHVKLAMRLEERMKFNVFALAGPGWMHEHTVCCGGHLSEDNRNSLVWDIGGVLNMSRSVVSVSEAISRPDSEENVIHHGANQDLRD
jgi:hypothetical protein